MSTLLISTGNRGKIVEIQDLLADLPAHVRVLIPADLGIDLDVVEDGDTYAENAARKALAYSRASGLITMADDSGLEVDALDGAPGLHSARYSPKPGATDADRRALVLENLRGLPRPWTARFHCTVAICTPEEKMYYTEGNCPGEIVPEERGTNGFGYDPIFFSNELGRTMAQMTREEKNRLSHRARAVRAALPILCDLLKCEDQG